MSTLKLGPLPAAIPDAFDTPQRGEHHDDMLPTVDMSVVLSSELLCSIMEEYYNKIMKVPKKKVRVIDVNTTERTGLVQFSLAFVEVDDAKTATRSLQHPQSFPKGHYDVLTQGYGPTRPDTEY